MTVTINGFLVYQVKSVDISADQVLWEFEAYGGGSRFIDWPVASAVEWKAVQMEVTPDGTL